MKESYSSQQCYWKSNWKKCVVLSIKISSRGVLGSPESPGAAGNVAHFPCACIQPILEIMHFNWERLKTWAFHAPVV